MMFHPRFLSLILAAILILSFTSPVGAADVKALATQAKAALRAAENTGDATVLKARLDEAKALIGQIKAADPKYSELSVIEKKFRYLGGILDASPAQTAKAETPASADGSEVSRVIADWEALVTLTLDFRQKTDRFFPNDQNIVYDPAQIDDVLALTADVQNNDQPKILSFLKDFTAKYGEPGDATDRKIIALTPKDPQKGMYDDANKRPDELPSRCHQELIDRLTWVKENPKAEAKRILKTVKDRMADNDFIMDTERDNRFAEQAAELEIARRFAPEDPEIAKAVSDLKNARTQSQADITKALDAARFPADTTAFAGPGKLPDLIAATRTYFSSAYPKETLLSVSVSGDWFATKQNIFGEPIQWGLPVYCASRQNEQDVCRVFQMTVLTGIGVGVDKAPPFTDHWTGDSYRMRIGNLK